MKFIATADWHLSLYGQSPININSNLPQTLHDIIKVIENIANYAINEKIDKIVIAGDIFHNKSIIYSVAQSLFLDFIRKFKKIEFILISGNHDCGSRASSLITSLKCTESESNVTMIYEPTIIENIIFVPWNPKTMINTIKESKCKYLVSHFGLNEAALSSGISVVSDISLKDLKHFKYCFLGHYHKPQNISNVYYSGSIIQLDLGERNEEKRFLVVDTDNDIIESIPTEGYKKHFRFSITKENEEEIIQKANELRNIGHYVEFEKKDKFDTTNLEKEFRIIDKTDVDITNRGINSSMSISEKINRYLEIKEIPENQIEFYKEIANECIESSI